MEVKEILKTAIIFLDKNELLEDACFLDSIGEDYVENTDRSTEIKKLTECLNLVYQEISSEYIPLIIEEKISVIDRKISYINLSKPIQEIISIKSLNNQKIKFETFPEFIQLESDHDLVKIKYAFEPEILNLESSFYNYAGKIPARVLAYGVAMEYCFISGITDEAYIWEARYKDSLKNIIRKKHNIILPKRRWI